MRLFVAVHPPPPALDHLEAAVQVARAEHPQLRWTPRERWHLTVTFLGEVDERVVPQLEERLVRAASRHEAVSLRVAGAGRFGRSILWAGIGGDTAALQRLAASTSAAGRRCGIGVEKRRYHPHFTLARSRGEGDLAGAVAALSAYEGPNWQAGELVLVRSELGPEPVYTDVLRAPLGGRTVAG